MMIRTQYPPPPLMVSLTTEYQFFFTASLTCSRSEAEAEDTGAIFYFSFKYISVCFFKVTMYQKSMQIMSYLRPRGLICSFAKKSISWLEHTWWPGLKNTWWPKKTPGGLASFEPGVSSLFLHLCQVSLHPCLLHLSES